MIPVRLDFVSMLQDMLSALFSDILAPILRSVAEILINLASSLIKEILADFLLKIWIIFLKLIAFLEAIFDIFCGTVSIGTRVGGQDVSTGKTLLDYMFSMSEVQTAFLAITMIAIVLAFLTTTISVASSISSSILDNKRPISQVLREAAKAAATFAIVPITCLFALYMITQITVVLDSSINYENATSDMSDLIFITAAADAQKSVKSDSSGEASKSSEVIEQFSSGHKYQDADDVKKYFNVNEINYILAYISSILVAALMFICILQFIQRIFLVLLLYLASPFFVAYMPLDGGKKFKEWRNQFVAHLTSAFGPLLTMKIYFMVIPVFLGDQIEFGVTGDVKVCLRLILIIGGAFAVFQSRTLLISLISPAASGTMEQSTAMAAFLGGWAGKKVGNALFGGNKNKKQQAQNSGQNGGQQGGSQAFTGR